MENLTPAWAAKFTTIFGEYLYYDSKFKLIVIILAIIITVISYILVSIITKAFKLSDIKLKY